MNNYLINKNLVSQVTTRKMFVIKLFRNSFTDFHEIGKAGQVIDFFF